MKEATPAGPTSPSPFAESDWFDPLEEAMRGQVRAFIEELLEEELEAALGRGRYERDAGSKGRRHGRRQRQLVTTFGPLTLSVPRARLADEAGEREWKSELLPAYRRLSHRAEALIAEVYLAGMNTRWARRALARLFEGHVGKDAVSRFAGSQDGRGGRPERERQKTRSAWQAWQERDLAGEDIVRLILDGTVVRVRLDRKATSISLLIALGVRRDGQKVVLAIRNMGGERGHANIKLPTGEVRPLSGFFTSVAESGERKSAADQIALQPIRTREDNLRKVHGGEALRYENARAAWDSERRRILNDNTVIGEDKEAALDKLGPPPQSPLEPLLTCPEPTFEGLCRLLQ